MWWPTQVYNGNPYTNKTVSSYWIEVQEQDVLFKSLWPSDTIWRHKSGSTLAQVMACCLPAPSHYLNQCWLIIRKVQWHPSENNCTRDSSAIIEISLKITYLKFCSNLPGANELKPTYTQTGSIFLPNPHNIHPVAGPWGQALGCLLWAHPTL